MIIFCMKILYYAVSFQISKIICKVLLKKSLNFIKITTI
ncbi:hypothetical protein A1OE_1282 [Candidatus Endolissoclinum faulkneri L2]|uniref:Uncharacterized protein n=1 Tax=Candidatus Endolissoclinum faulkneri L2 TaxID=1193729 RepID=K7YIN4_9PROT|nr:hypothetical protein A1OE_1282 [Candidatus Endolissoclinum faulkneri L2]